MPLSLTYRTTDNSRWGGGQGSALTSAQVDINFWNVFQAIEAVEAAQVSGAGIDYISQPVGGNTFYVHLTDHRVLGPFTLPAAQWNPRGQWQPLTPYAALDVISENGQLYLVTVSVTSAATFSTNATDGNGNTVYVQILAAPQSALPAGGTVGQRLVKSNGSPYVTQWESDSIRIFAQCIGLPDPGETILQYTVADPSVLPVGLAGSVIYSAVDASAPAVWTINKNNNPIGTITFAASPDFTVAFATNVVLNPGDVITLVAPSTQDATLSNISFTLVATLTL